MDKMAAPVVGIALIAAIASGVYAYMLRGELRQERAALMTAQQGLEASQRVTEDANRKSAIARAALDTCNTLLAETQGKLDAATSKVRKR